MPEPAPKAVNAIIDHAKKQDVRMVDVKFADVFGQWRHFAIPMAQLSAESFRSGLAFEGSLTRNSALERLVAIPDPGTAFVDPFFAVPTLSLTANVARRGTKQAHPFDVRAIAARAEKSLHRSGVADAAMFGARLEFFIFDNAQFDLKSSGSFCSVDSEEAAWNTSREEMPNLGYKVRRGEGSFSPLPADTQQDIRTEMCLMLEQLGIRVLRHQHEAGTAGHASIELQSETLLKSADTVMLCKYVIKNIARRHGKTATFMPMPLFGDSGSAMRTTLSLLAKGKPLFSGEHPSKPARQFLSGVSKRAKSLCAFTNPTTNSYRRLASKAVSWNHEGSMPENVEFHVPDGSANPYLCFAALLLAGLDGSRGKSNSADQRSADLSALPRSLDEALDALERDSEFLLGGDVFTQEFLDTWVQQKRQEHEALQLRPHPYEFHLYYDA